MNPQVQARLEKVQSTSRSAKRVCFLLMVLVSLAAGVMVATTLTIPETLTCGFDGVRRPCGELSSQVLAFGVVAVVGGLALVLAGLDRLARLFQHYAHGEIFTRASVREIRLLAYVAVAYALFQFGLFIATLVLFAGGAVEWPTSFRVEIPVGPTIMASFLLLLSWVMDVGAELREENELTV